MLATVHAGSTAASEPETLLTVTTATLEFDGQVPRKVSNSSTSTGATFDGSFTSDGTVAGTKGTGTWSDPSLGSGTWSCQHQ